MVVIFLIEIISLTPTDISGLIHVGSLIIFAKLKHNCDINRSCCIQSKRKTLGVLFKRRKTIGERHRRHF